MKSTHKLNVVLGILIVALSLIYVKTLRDRASVTVAFAPVPGTQEVPIEKTEGPAEKGVAPSVGSRAVAAVAPAIVLPPSSSPLKLKVENFKATVLQCFTGKPCEFAQDPMEMYRTFRRSNNHQATDLLISFLRSKLRDPRFAERYKNTLKEMIDDFYPESEKQFQEAAYYNYLGDLDRSLALYLDLEKRAAKDPSLRGAPKHNIANTYYDLGRYNEALSYYEAALNEYETGEVKISAPSQDQMIQIVKGRIDDIHHRAKF